MKIAIMGIGGVGGLVGATLANKYDNISFICRGKTLEAIKKNGIDLNSTELGHIHAHPTMVTDNPKDIGTVDILILTVKGYSLEEACIQCRYIVDENTLIVPFQNGVNISSDVRKYMDKPAQYADGCIYCFSYATEPGKYYHFGKGYKIDIGFTDEHRNEKADELIQMFNSVDIRANFSPEVSNLIWNKYIMMCGYACIFSHYDAPAGEVHASKERMDFARNIFAELAQIAMSLGIELRSDIVDYCFNAFAASDPETTNSLYRDLRDGKPKKSTEFYSIIGRAVDYCNQLSLDSPYLRAAYKVCDERYK